MMKEMWNARYSSPEYAYGIEPNQYFKAQIQQLKPGKALFAAEGEGRNAVYAAKLGWDVDAFDISEAGKKKADRLAKNENVIINYKVGDIKSLNFEKEKYDLLVLIFAHFPAQLKTAYHKLLSQYLKSGGVVILEAFSKSHLKFNMENPKAGGPKHKEMLFSTVEIAEDFSDYKVQHLSEYEGLLDEGQFHKGMSSVIRFVGIKK
jgi:SAM-dependent methyltransferase